MSKLSIVVLAVTGHALVCAGCAGSSSEVTPTDAAPKPVAYVSCDKHVARDATCPMAQPEDKSACSSAGLICDFPRTDGWDSCRCRDPGDGRAAWQCFGYSITYDCPLTRPENGAPCPGEAGRRCAFLRDLACTCEVDRVQITNRNVLCSCDSATQSWRCENQPLLGQPPEAKKFAESVCIGTSIDLTRPPVEENTPVASLTDADAAAWCKWFVAHARGEGPPPPSHPPITNPDGSVAGYGFRWCGPPISACVASVSEDICLMSLRRRSCSAPLKALTDCYFTIANSCEPVGVGCLGLRSKPECLETVVQLDQTVGDQQMCPVPLR
jgi:hypothetical protein